MTSSEVDALLRNLVNQTKALERIAAALERLSHLAAVGGLK